MPGQLSQVYQTLLLAQSFMPGGQNNLHLQYTLECYILVQFDEKWEVFFLLLFGQPRSATIWNYCPTSVTTAHE